MLRPVAALLLFLATVLPAAAEETQTASEAMQAGNYAVAYCIWLPQARAGDSVAQYNIGWMYHNGYGLAIDDAQARQWWELAASQGHTEAQFAMAMLYTQGTRQIKKSLADAIPYYLAAAHAGHEDARLILLSMFGPDDHRGHQLAPQLSSEDWAMLGNSLQIRSKRANLRRDATLEAAIIKTLKQGQKLVEVARQKRWLHVIDTDKGISGWMHDSLVEASQPLAASPPPPPTGPYSSSSGLPTTVK